MTEFADMEKQELSSRRLTSARLPAPSHNVPVAKLVIRVGGCVPHQGGEYGFSGWAQMRQPLDHTFLEAGALWDPTGDTLGLVMCNVFIRDLER